MPNFDSISEVKQHLVRKALSGGLFVARESAAAVTTANLFGADKTLAALPTGYSDGGYLTPEGIRFSRAQESEDIAAWQSQEPVRSDRTSDSETLAVDFLETNKTTIELFTGADLSSPTYVNGALSIKKPALPTDRYYRLVALGVDIIDGDEFYAAVVYPRAKPTTFQDQAFSKAGALQWGLTFTTYADPTLGYSKDTIFGGPGFGAVAADMGFTLPA